MERRSARILLVIFTLSASLTQVVELGHQILHSFQNPIHYHKVRKYKDVTDHSLKDHHFQKMKFSHEMDEPQSPSNFIALTFGFFQEFPEYNFYHRILSTAFRNGVIERDYRVDHSPPTPPPLVVG